MGSTRLCSLAKYTVPHFSVVVTLYFPYLLTKLYSLPLMSSNGVRLFSWPCRPWNCGTVVFLFLQPYSSFWRYYIYILFLHSKLPNITLVWKIYNNIKINSLMSWSCALNLTSGNFYKCWSNSPSTVNDIFWHGSLIISLPNPSCLRL